MSYYTQAEKELIEEAEKIVTDDIVNEILMTSRISWDNIIEPDDLNNWLSNFTGEALGSSAAEKSLALWLLSGVVYFNIRDVRAFCKNLFDEYIHKKLVEYRIENRYQDLNTEKQIAHILDSTCFLAMGNDSESGANVLYYFRQINKLSRSVFDKNLDVEYENLVFVDDVSVSGAQALQYIPSVQQAVKHQKSYYLAFLASREATDELKHISVEVICCNYLTDRERCFSKDSYVFSTEAKQQFIPITAKMCEYYGKKITKGHVEAEGYPLGFDQGQCLFCFFYNTPDNTLPIFWCNGHGWKPLFTRYEKIYDLKETQIYDSEYV